MKYNSKEEYEKGQEFAHEIEMRINSYEHILCLVDRVIDDIKYIYEYDQQRALELKQLLHEKCKFVKEINFTNKKNSDESFREWIEQLETIFYFDPERGKEIAGSFITTRNKREETKARILEKEDGKKD